LKHNKYSDSTIWYKKCDCNLFNNLAALTNSAAFYSGTIDKSQFVRNKKETQSNTSTSSGSSDENANDMEKGQWHKRKRQGVPGSQTKLKSGRMSAGNHVVKIFESGKKTIIHNL
jgi:hypothetical protein